MPTPHAARLAALFAVLASATAMAIEEPLFQVLEQEGSFELREYPAYVVAETRVEAGFASAGNIAFQRLFGYISGKNVAQQKIAMTAPVTQSRSEARGEKIAMTAPVSQVADGRRLPRRVHAAGNIHAEDGPEACDPTVQIREVPAQVIACWRYTGRSTESNYRDNEKLLREQIAKRGLAIRGEPILARYNPPFTPWFMRRNEVMIPVKPPPKR